MFRKMRRYKQELSEDECIRILEKEPRGVLAVHGEDGYPYAFPMNYIYIEGALYFHCAGEGHKMDAVKADNRVSFCVYDKGYKKDGEWSLNIKSVIVFGTVEIMTDKTKMRDVLLRLAMKYHPTHESAEKELENAFDRVTMLKIAVDKMTGKLVNES